MSKVKVFVYGTLARETTLQYLGLELEEKRKVVVPIRGGALVHTVAGFPMLRTFDKDEVLNVTGYVLTFENTVNGEEATADEVMAVLDNYEGTGYLYGRRTMRIDGEKVHYFVGIDTPQSANLFREGFLVQGGDWYEFQAS